RWLSRGRSGRDRIVSAGLGSLAGGGVVFGYRRQKWLGIRRRLNFAAQNLAERDIAAVKRASIAIVLLDPGAIQGNPGKQAASARVSEHLGAHFPISHALGVAPDRAGRGGSIRVQVNMARATR